MACAALVASVGLALLAPSAFARRPPGAVTTVPTAVAPTSATFTGVVAPHGIDTTYFFQYGTAGYEHHTALAAAGDGREPVTVSTHVDGLTPATTYRVRLVAFSSYRITTGNEVAFATQAAPAALGVAPLPLLLPPPPVFGERVNVSVRSGTVSVKPPGGDFQPVSEFASIPVGSVVNTRNGAVRLRSALPSGGTQAGNFHGGKFKVRQPRAAGGMTELALRGRLRGCRRDEGSTTAVSARKRRRRALWGRVTHGSFRTRGGNSVATVRGTVWYVEDRCDGTLTRVKRGSVRVRDLRRDRTVVVRAGDSYFARATR